MIPRGERKFYQTAQGSGLEDTFRTETLRARNKFHLEHASVHRNIEKCKIPNSGRQMHSAIAQSDSERGIDL